jgi:hypothetical protein
VKTLARARDKAEILARLQTIRPDSTRRWGQMTAHGMICHLNDSFLAVLGRREVSMATGPLQSTLIKWLALYAPLPWPKGVATRPEIDQTIGGTPPGEFAADVAQLVTLVEFVTTQPGCFREQKHPIFGPMSDATWLRWGYLHMDHHFRQFGA